MDSDGVCQPANTARLDVDVACRADAQGLLDRPDTDRALVQADRCLDLLRQLRMVQQVIERQRLLDERQPNLVDLLEHREIVQ